MTRAAVLLAALTLLSGCVSAPTAATPPPARVPTGLPLVISGASNAENLYSIVDYAHLYPQAVCAGCQGSTSIARWAEGSALWTQLAQALQPPLTAFIWWEGEADFNIRNLTYAADLRAFMARVRAANHSPHLLIVVVQIVPYLDNQFIRDAQREVVQSDPDALLVDVDDLPTDGLNHLRGIPEYVTAMQRVLAAIQMRQ